ncbi:right-handed parallel beta-helix repeat-containing protein [Streptomyces sp. NPDC001380]|uniref:right-handed parallel beta-helix repeat-containing protein n=1 Tax=Streptomyces sp. NPDC001380 TaxID=3364566 RepID=UPI0036B09D42
MPETPPMPTSPPTPPPGGGRPEWMRGPAVWLAGGAFLIALVALVVALSGGGDGGGQRVAGAGATGQVGPTLSTGTPSDAPASPAPGTGEPSDAPSASDGASVPPAPGSDACPVATTTVQDADGLQRALTDARPGDVIQIADGTYTGKFTAKTPGTEQQPIVLCGGPGAVIDGGGVKKGYALHLDGASWWRVIGFTVRNSQKGVMADKVQHTLIKGLTVTQIGDEAIHLRNFSSDNTVEGNTVSDTGLRRDKFGEGIYIGSAVSNWPTVSGGRPDNSDRNTVRGNRISGTTAESVDIKEGTSHGVLEDNTFDGSKLKGSHNDSWVDVKGNDWLIQGNTGTHSLADGFQTHQVVDGWGKGNVFKDNTAQVDGPGYGFNVQSPDSNTVACSNKATAAAKGLTNGTCS